MPKVIIRPAPGADVSVAGIDVYADNLEIRDMKADWFQSFPESDGFTARNLDLGPFFVYGSTNTSVIGGDIGPSYNPGGSSAVTYITYGTAADGTRVAPKNTLIDGALFHDFRRGTPEDHMECLFVVGGDGITIRNSRFTRCDVFSIFFQQFAGPNPPTNIVMENNFFDISTVDGSLEQCCTYYAVLFDERLDRFQNISIRYNSARQAIAFASGPPIQNVSFVGNLAPLGQYACLDNVTYAYNVWYSSWTQPAKCSATDKPLAVGDPGWVDAAHLDLHLKAGSAAINAGPPLRMKKEFPKRDIDGQLRPLGKRADAGADEFR
jgi:hypothetical protein